VNPTLKRAMAARSVDQDAMAMAVDAMVTPTASRLHHDGAHDFSPRLVSPRLDPRLDWQRFPKFRGS